VERFFAEDQKGETIHPHEIHRSDMCERGHTGRWLASWNGDGDGGARLPW